MAKSAAKKVAEPKRPGIKKIKDEEVVSAPDLTERKGHVVSISGSHALVIIDDHISTDTTNIQIGNLLKMSTGKTLAYGVVSGLMVPVPKKDNRDTEMAVAQVDLIGESELNNGEPGKFRHGVSVYPTLGCEVRLAERQDLARVFSTGDKMGARIGTLHQDPEIPAVVSIDALLGKHMAILGTTGSGKSCAATVILRAILKSLPNGHVLMLDMHNEYSTGFNDMANKLTAETLQLPYWLLTFEEIREVLISSESPTREEEKSILGNVILDAKRRFLSSGESAYPINVDTPVPYRMSDALRAIDEGMGRLEKTGNVLPYRKIKEKIKSLQGNPRYRFMFPGLSVRDNMTEILAELFRVPVAGKPITIVDLSGMPSEILNVVVSVMSRLAFDFALWNNQKIPVLLVCEEAHRYAPRDKSLGFEPAKRALARIAKEGRKYGVSLCVISQRPSDLDIGVLSQCNTIIALRTTNQADRDFVGSAISDCGTGFLDFLPSLRIGEALIIGDAAKVPMRVFLDRLDDRDMPKSSTATFSDAWSVDNRLLSLDKLVDRWRRRGR